MADISPTELRGTAFGWFNLTAGYDGKGNRLGSEGETSEQVVADVGKPVLLNSVE